MLSLRIGADSIARTTSIAVMSNTTSPATDLAMADQHMANANDILRCTANSPMSTCPNSLFAEIIHINYLRHRAAVAYAGPRCETEVSQILQRIASFDVESWTLCKSNEKNRQHWRLLGRVYKQAVALYCVLSLDSLVGSSASSADFLTQQLLSSVNKAIKLPPLKRFMFWPLVVMGVGAFGRLDDVNMDGNTPSSKTRIFVLAQLVELSHHLGSFSPLAAKHLLENFWKSGRTWWDDCFDRPYVFTSQIAVDTRVRPQPEARRPLIG